jgi:hypothetical protein
MRCSTRCSSWRCAEQLPGLGKEFPEQAPLVEATRQGYGGDSPLRPRAGRSSLGAIEWMLSTLLSKYIPAS